MEKSFERRILYQPFQKVTHINLTNFPTFNLRNPGIGLKVFDIMLPLNGHETFERKKEETPMIGSIEQKLSDKSHISQEGFGAENKLSDNVNDTSKVLKLGSIFDAMQEASVKTTKYAYEPKKLKAKQKVLKTSKKHKFSFV